jgi:hypothetical protein
MPAQMHVQNPNIYRYQANLRKTVDFQALPFVITHFRRVITKLAIFAPLRQKTAPRGVRVT